MNANPNVEEAFLARLKEIVGERCAGAVHGTMRGPKDQAYWVNPLVAGEAGLPGEPVDGAPNCYFLPASRRSEITASPAAVAGSIYPVNPSSVVAVQNLAPQPDEEVLDLAAAPGGKDRKSVV